MKILFQRANYDIPKEYNSALQKISICIEVSLLAKFKSKYIHSSWYSVILIDCNFRIGVKVNLLVKWQQLTDFGV